MRQHDSPRVVEAALGALCTLVNDRVDVDRSVSALAELDAPWRVLRALSQHDSPRVVEATLGAFCTLVDDRVDVDRSRATVRRRDLERRDPGAEAGSGGSRIRGSSRSSSGSPSDSSISIEEGSARRPEDDGGIARGGSIWPRGGWWQRDIGSA
ncbi:hypothetical protein ZWY2020_021712 [Hordeum vulgare]|nr:hypothetical protein ZWY2020_021712 [Hordeum vulgare]